MKFVANTVNKQIYYYRRTNEQNIRPCSGMGRKEMHMHINSISKQCQTQSFQCLWFLRNTVFKLFALKKSTNLLFLEESSEKVKKKKKKKGQKNRCKKKYSKSFFFFLFLLIFG
jgi:hypothetical protein